MDISYSGIDSSSSSCVSLKRRRDPMNEDLITDGGNAPQQRVGGGGVDSNSSIESEASSLCSNTNISWSSAEISFKRLRIRGPSPTTSSFSDCVIVESQQNNIGRGNEGYGGFNNFLGQLHLERRNRVGNVQQQQQQHHHHHHQLTPIKSNTQRDSCSVSVSEGSSNGWTLLHSDSQLY